MTLQGGQATANASASINDTFDASPASCTLATARSKNLRSYSMPTHFTLNLLAACCVSSSGSAKP